MTLARAPSVEQLGTEPDSRENGRQGVQRIILILRRFFSRRVREMDGSKWEKKGQERNFF